MVDQIHRLFHELRTGAVLLRHDKRHEAPPHPRGGFLVGEALALDTIKFFFGLNRIVALYEPADPLLNMHNMNVMFESNQEVCVEVVGPGFDASDLQRGDLSPHETFSAAISHDGGISELKLIRRVDPPTYKESVILRKDKIRRKLESTPSPELAPRIRKALGVIDDLDMHLRNINSPLGKSDHYQPVSQKLVYDTIASILSSQIIGRFKDSTGVGFPLVFSTSLVNRGEKQVFWDIVSPRLKFEGLKHSAPVLPQSTAPQKGADSLDDVQGSSL